MMQVEEVGSPGLSRQRGSYAIYSNKKGIKVTFPFMATKI